MNDINLELSARIADFVSEVAPEYVKEGNGWKSYRLVFDMRRENGELHIAVKGLLESLPEPTTYEGLMRRLNP